MRPLELILCGWGPYRDKVVINFRDFEGQGLFLITGPTGAGKTTLFDAITYALYGALSGEMRDKERAGVRSDFAPEGIPTYVELTMEHGGKVYRVNRNPRYLRPKKRSKGSNGFVEEKENAVLYLPDDTVLEGVKEVNARLLQILALDYSQFKQISMIAQGEFARLLTAPPKDKTRIFREIFGTGIYDRFTYALGNRSRNLYTQVMEQKHKLNEDIRMLTHDLEHSRWRPEMRERLLGLTGEQNWNYAEVKDCLKEMEQIAADEVREAKQAYLTADKKVERLTRCLTELKEENLKIRQFHNVAEEKDKIKAEHKIYAEREKMLAKAINATMAEPAEVKAIQSSEDVRKNREAQKLLTKELEALQQELSGLSYLAENKEKLEMLIIVMADLETLQKEYGKLDTERKGKEKVFAEGQKSYLEKEELCRRYKQQYEEADRQRKLSAIGIAASLLKEGSPCPVCGSLHHPKPAAISESIISEEELESLKEQWETAQKELTVRHEKVVQHKTGLEILKQNSTKMRESIEEKQVILKQQEGKFVSEYLALTPAKAGKRFREETERLQQLGILIEEKQKQQERLAAEEKEAVCKAQEAEALFRDALTQCGFQSKVEYERARMTRKEREQLDLQLKEYRKREAANRELYEHLKASVKSAEEKDPAPVEAELAEVRQNRKDALEGQKVWDRHLAEVRRTLQLMQNRREQMESKEKEYGYVKDLENMACGNNSKKLVFEQYVLAGYFEEILRAANLRFSRMTSGRYEMSRVGQVGDGRVKDNLEIQVMDHYTGKYRSVRTLSGGETFKASLALALGMSDVVQAMSGGIRVDTLFIDEGFGALDSESLDQACETLMSLVEKKRLIGIISHVQELRERIDRQLIVDRTASGSTVRVV